MQLGFYEVCFCDFGVGQVVVGEACFGEAYLV